MRPMREAALSGIGIGAALIVIVSISARWIVKE
jgi:hypothetical protein